MTQIGYFLLAYVLENQWVDDEEAILEKTGKKHVKTP
jgi:hypothetical protein